MLQIITETAKNSDFFITALIFFKLFFKGQRFTQRFSRKSQWYCGTLSLARTRSSVAICVQFDGDYTLMQALGS